MEKTRFVCSRSIVLVLAIAGCSGRPCREPRLPELDQTKKSTSQPIVPLAETELKAAADQKLATPTRINVYKADGSRQCEKARGLRRGIAAEVMERELAGIAVYSREKRADGLMHIQICGNPTGMINVFEIDSSFLNQAVQRGFKRLED